MRGRGFISIHALREEGDNSSLTFVISPSSFLSTPSARRATHCGRDRIYHRPISIHALREEGDLIGGERRLTACISIHALREEGDAVYALSQITTSHFYPRPPRGGRPGRARCSSGRRNFYPRPPRGGRRGGGYTAGTFSQFLSTPSARRATSQKSKKSCLKKLFLSTPSARRATSNLTAYALERVISIHALREEGD